MSPRRSAAMAQCVQSVQEFLQDSFVPLVAALCSEEAERLARRNNLGFAELLKPFCRLTSEGRYPWGLGGGGGEGGAAPCRPGGGEDATPCPLFPFSFPFPGFAPAACGCSLLLRGVREVGLLPEAPRSRRSGRWVCVKPTLPGWGLLSCPAGVCLVPVPGAPAVASLGVRFFVSCLDTESHTAEMTANVTKPCLLLPVLVCIHLFFFSVLL